MGSQDSAPANAGSGVLAVRTRGTVGVLRSRPRARVLIIGGGINGVGTFRDLALQGIDVALVERGDYCSGASGASSHMIHGGIRYLENGEFRLVKESVQERNGLLQTAPHYVKPLKTTIPIYSTFSGIFSAPLRFLTHRQGKRTERGAFLIKLGLSIYDAFSRGGGMVPRHQFAGRARALKELPRLNPDIKYAATYFDASVHNPERLTLDVLRDGEAANLHARALNYVSVISSGADGVEMRDELTGETFSFVADIIINTTGAWVDETNAALRSPSQFMGGTKGSHIVLDHPELLEACAGRELFFEHTDGRIVLIYPIGDRVLVGTTDIEATDPDRVVCTEDEIDYFFDLIAHVLPAVQVRREHIVYSFSGVRPLPRHDDTQPGFVSRDYRIERQDEDGPDGTVTTLSLVGGKWTTFRALAEHITNDVLVLLDRTRKVSTSGLPIGGGRDFPSTNEGMLAWVRNHASSAVPIERAQILLERYGTRAAEVIEYLQNVEDRIFDSTRELSTGEVRYMVEHEHVGHLSDVLIRRTSLAFRGLVTAGLLEELAAVLATALDWGSQRAGYEVEHAKKMLHRFHGVHVQSLIA